MNGFLSFLSCRPHGEMPEEMNRPLEQDSWLLLSGLSDEAEFRSLSDQEGTMLTTTYIGPVLEHLRILMYYYDYTMLSITQALRKRKLNIWLFPREPAPGHVAQHPLTKETQGYTYVVDVFFGTEAKFNALLQTLGETPFSVEKKLATCALEVNA